MIIELNSNMNKKPSRVDDYITSHIKHLALLDELIPEMI